MLTISPAAQQHIAHYFQNRRVSPVRIIFDTGG